MWNEGQHFGTVQEKLDSFPHLAWKTGWSSFGGASQGIFRCVHRGEHRGHREGRLEGIFGVKNVAAFGNVPGGEISRRG